MRIKDMRIGDLLTCSKCGEEVQLTETMQAKETRICMACLSKYSVKWAKNNRGKKRESNNRYHKSLGPKRAKYTARYRNRHPLKKTAWQKVQTALRNGSLEKEPCEECGDIKVHAHHDDYSRPLDVRWLCHEHHMQKHDMEARDK